MFRSHTLPTRRQAMARCALSALIPLVCAVMLTAAVSAPAPSVALPLIVLVCIGYQMVAALELPVALAILGATRSESRIRRRLARRAEVRGMLKELEGAPRDEPPARSLSGSTV